MPADDDNSRRYRVSAPDGTWPRGQWPVDVQRTDASGEFDLEQLEHNLSLSPTERLEKASQWAEFADIVREAGRRFHGLEHRHAPPPK